MMYLTKGFTSIRQDRYTRECGGILLKMYDTIAFMKQF